MVAHEHVLVMLCALSVSLCDDIIHCDAPPTAPPHGHTEQQLHWRQRELLLKLRRKHTMSSMRSSNK